VSGVPTLGRRVICAKSRLRAVRTAVISVVLAGGLSQGATIAAVPVEDSLFRAAAELDTQTFNNRTSEVDEDQDLWAPASQSTAATSALVGEQPLFYQMQVLQQEVRQLSGLVEEQARLIQKLQQDQRLQYIDLDRRVAALAPNRPAPGPTPLPDVDRQSQVDADVAGSESSLPDPGTTEATVQSEPEPTTEREAYARAIRWMRSKRFEESTVAFEKLIVDYPNGQYTPNAFYWLGELHLATSNMEPARQNFVQVIRLYPDHQKVPDALYKLGVLYFQLGDESESRRYLTQVQTDFPQSSAGALAKRYLAEME
jgi:tol-pal system protein YbgF